MRKKALSWLLCLILIFTVCAPVTYAVDEPAEGEQQEQVEESSTPAPQPEEDKTDIEEDEDGPDTPAPSDPVNDPEEPESTVAPEDPENTEDPEAPVEPEDPEDPEEPADDIEFDVEAAYAYVMSLGSEEAIEAYLETLTEDQLDELIAYAYSLAEENYVPPTTVTYTNAGPFLPAVDVSTQSTFSLFSAAMGIVGASARSDVADGLELSKTVTANADGSYTITLEAYTTGEVVTTEVTTPVDIVLVLDQSGSMAYNFAGDTTSTNSARRQYAMKQAVNNFIDAVAAQYSETGDHRISIVTFGDSADPRMNWTYVDSAGQTSLKSSISSLADSPSGATNTAAGMTQASNLMGSGYNYTGQNTTRQKVVIVFTDGVPTTSSDFDTGVANSALSTAATMKAAGVTIYTVGIFNGANVSQLYGSTGFSNDSDGTVGSHWSIYAFLGITTNSNDVDIPAGNRFLNYLSSNFKTASSIGLTTYNTRVLGTGQLGWQITANATRTTSGYYLTAANASELNDIFQTISQNIATASTSLTSAAVIRDIVTPYFTMPENTSDISVKTYDCLTYNASTGAATWAETGTVLSDAVTITGDTIEVTGFDFDENFVTEQAKSDGSHGKKIVITFTVSPKAEFMGGSGVPTNGEGSGVYEDGELYGSFETPTVDVPLNANFTVTGQTANIYLYNDVPDAEDLVTTSLDDLDSAMLAFVDISYAITPGTSSNTGDSTPTVSVTITSKTDPTNFVTKTATATVNVFTPEIEYQDSWINAGEMPDYETENYLGVKWKHGETYSDDVDVTVLGDPPELTYDYTPRSGYSASTDTDVGVMVSIGTHEITSLTTFVNDSGYGPYSPHQFVVHVLTASLTITKTGSNDTLDPNQSFIFRIEGADVETSDVNLTVVIKGDGSVTIEGLIPGEYTVTEEGGWSWRYDAAVNPVEITLTTSEPGTVTFANTRTQNSWFDGSAYEAFGALIPQ